MNADQVFVDTNILVYAHDLRAGKRHALAQSRLRELVQTRPALPAVSALVLQELYVNLTRKKIPAKAAREIVGVYLEWEVIPNDGALVRDGIAAAQRWKISLWDALIVV